VGNGQTGFNGETHANMQGFNVFLGRIKEIPAKLQFFRALCGRSGATRQELMHKRRHLASTANNQSKKLQKYSFFVFC
jgi:hypothetical protein